MVQPAEIQGLEKVRKGALYYIITSIVLPIAITILFIAIFSGTLLALSPTSIAAGAISSIVIVIIAAILALIFEILAYLNFREGFSILASLGKDVGIGKTGLTLILVGIILLIIPIIDIIGAILFVVGNILFGIGIYQLGSVYNNELTKIGGIITAIPFISFIGIIMTYIGINRLLKSISGTPPPPSPS